MRTADLRIEEETVDELRQAHRDLLDLHALSKDITLCLEEQARYNRCCAACVRLGRLRVACVRVQGVMVDTIEHNTELAADNAAAGATDLGKVRVAFILSVR